MTAFSGPDREAHLQNELGRFAPAEAVLNPGAAEDAALRALLEDKLRCHVERLPAGRFQLPAAEKRIRQQFGDDAAQRLPRDNPAAMLRWGRCWITSMTPKKRTWSTWIGWTTTGRGSSWSWI